MADIKVSQLQTAITTTQLDTFMIVQNGSNKKLTLQTLLGNLNTNVTVNSLLQDIDFCVNGLNKSNLLYVNAASNTVGIGTNDPISTLQVVGNIKIGEEKTITKTITSVTVGADGLDGYKEVTVNLLTTEDSITGIFNYDDVVEITGVLGTDHSNDSNDPGDIDFDPYDSDLPQVEITALNGFKKIGQNGDHSFKFKVPNEVVVDAGGSPLYLTIGENPIILNPTQNGSAVLRLLRPGVLLSSVEHVPHDSGSGIKFITANYETTALHIDGTCRFTLINDGITGQEKKIYLKTSQGATDIAIIENVNGLNFNAIRLESDGNSVTLKYDGSTWICLNSYGAVLYSTAAPVQINIFDNENYHIIGRSATLTKT